MDVEFHYYITYLIAAKAGFSGEEARIVAYSAQYIDDNNESYLVDKGRDTEFQVQISQTMNIFKPEEDQLRVYPVFHFIPGDPNADSAIRVDGQVHDLNTTPNSANAQAIFKMALDSNNLYRIGVACHGYVDTWAHQNFIGCNDSFNSMGEILPNLGHADAYRQPDQPALIWDDHRLANRRVDNKVRFLEAAEHLFDRFVYFKNAGIEQEDLNKLREGLLSDIDVAIGKEDPDNQYKENRIARYVQLASSKDYGGNILQEYDKAEWFTEAVRTELPRGKEVRTAGRSVSGTHDYFWENPEEYKQSNWCQFQEAVIEHQDETIDFLNNNNVLYKTLASKAAA